jgi:YVTN family beta-propeller protein
MKEQEGEFSNEKKDTFDESKRYVGIRLQQGVPLLERDWNELEDIRRYEELMLRRWYVGSGTPDDGFRISADNSSSGIRITAGRCIVDGFEAVNDPENEGKSLFTLDARFEKDLNKEGIVSKELKDEFEDKGHSLYYNARIRKRKENEWVIADTEKFIVKKVRVLKVYEVAKYILYSKQKDVDALTKPSGGVREDTVYLDVWIEEVTSAEDPALENSKDVNIETCVRHKLEWRVRVDEGSKGNYKVGYHHYYDLAEIPWEDGKIKEVKDLRTTKLTLTSVRNELEEVRRTSASKAELEYLRQATVNRWIKGGEINDEYEISEMLCIISGQEIKFGEAESEVEIKEDENFVVLANGLKKEIEFIVTRKNLLEWLNSWTFEKWLLVEDTKPVLKSAFSLPLYFFERPIGGGELNEIDLRPQGVLDTWLAELAGRLDSRKRRMSRVPLLQQTIFGKAVVAVTVGNSPRGVAFDGTHIWVANNAGKSVSKIDIATNEVENVTVETSPHGVAFDGTHIWVSHCGGKSVSRIDRATNKIENVTMGNYSPRGVAFDGAHIWVACSRTDNSNMDIGKVCMIDIARMENVKDVPVGENPYGVAFDGTHIWVANNGDSSVSKIDIAEMKWVKDVPVEESPRGVAFDGAHIWVANNVGNSVSKIDIATDVVETVLKGEIEEPSGIAFDGANIWVANSYGDSVSKIDIATMKKVKDVPVGDNPYGVAFDGTHIWVANNNNSSVSKILRGDLE